jgi:multiple sugar transport system substrate-binding protein
MNKINVTFWHSMGMAHSVILNRIISDFEKENPDVQIHSVYQGSYDSLLTTLIASNTAGTNPVMSQMYESWTTRFIEHDLILPVIDLARDYGGLEKNDIDDFVRDFIEDNAWNQKLTTLPFNKSAYVLYFNRDAMKEIGMTDENGKGRAPVTWNEMRMACKRLTKQTKGEVVRYGLGIRPFIEGYTTFLFRAGGRYLDPVSEKVEFADETGLNTLRFLYDLVYKDKTAYIEPDYLSTAFGSGRIAMFVGSTASLPYNEKAVAGKFEWDTAPIPFPEGKENISRTLFQGTNVGIFRNHSKQKLEAAWRFMRFLTNTESSTTWSIGTGYLPIRYSVLKTERMQKLLEENPTYKAPVSLLDNAQFEPRLLIWEPMRTVITDHIEAALNGRRTPEETIESMKTECEKIIDTF